MASQTAKAKNDQATASASKTTSFVFSDLQTLQSHHMMLKVNMTASQAASTLRIFQSTQGVMSSQDFNIATPACVSATTVSPVITPVGVTPAVVTPVVTPVFN
jgi:hypothetical protein